MKFCFDSKQFVEVDIDPQKMAVSGADFDLSWRQFKSRVESVSSWICSEKEINHKLPIIVYGHKSADMLVCFYACMQARVPYVPVDEIYPNQRIEKIISAAKPAVIINTTAHSLSIKGLHQKFVSEIIEQDVSEYKSDDSEISDPIIYTLFTSGSTGEPKGVQISNEAILSFTSWMANDFGFRSDDVFINTAILSFDLSVFEVMTFGVLGASLVLNDKETVANPNELLQRIETYSGTIWVSTPSFAFLYSRIENLNQLASINAMLFCGEVLPNTLANKLLDKLPHAKVWNTYGPTEATVATTLLEVTSDIIEKFNPLPVGYPRRDSEIIIDNNEIVIVGDHVSVGYLNLNDLNAQKFEIIDGKRAFKTGDMGYLSDGMLFFKGRNDDLVKLHGYRIELNEISSTLNSLPEVLLAETIALKRNGETKKIVSLVQLRSKKTIPEISDLKHRLSVKIPSYMIPSDIKFVKDIPLNQNGKADKKRLLELYMTR